MSNYINQVSDSLKNHISELANNPCLFLRNPNVDFSRKRKIDFKTFIGIMMNSGGATMSKELLDFFDFNKNTPSVSAFTQQRSKVLPEAFEYLFKSFTDDNLPTTNNYHGYRLIAYSIGRHRFIELARAAGATYKINEGTGGTVLVNLEIFDNYMEQFRQPVRPLKEPLYGQEEGELNE